MYEQNDRQDLADSEKAELEILENYLPKQLSEAEIQTEVDAVISSMGDVNMQQMGQVIGAVKAKLGTSADGAIVAQIVKRIANKIGEIHDFILWTDGSRKKYAGPNAGCTARMEMVIDRTDAPRKSRPSGN